ncbi:sodium/proton antiporter, NhaA family (TC 2.A.33.1.1) [Aliiroseovarius crassostreae]|uniref:Na(+)/H(+) antiporter NhaA n=1 Tax=Aliiroseovarius crassostreae TaxID=154981 RepID=A0A0N8IBZ4_9RHOB|nr:Na+/H+ antiporter NhaA [Aliiroseovarius crassostreae]KPN64475.1 sodium:proton antiporter [Aliiroseovarius crassostreae]SFU35767.1 sodium/proton antiporter, NhaA family (TC 2.A.33.1.1) [Aliiroseovarius crassostreae]
MYRVWNFITTYSVLLISGALLALVWANTNASSYHHFVEYPLWFNDWVGVDIPYWKKSFGEEYAKYFQYGDAGKVVTLHYLVNDMLMAMFFAIAGKEVWEAVILKNGSLRGKKAATPLVATAGGMLGPIAVYLGIALLLGSSTFDAVARGWAIPTATDIAFSYLVGRLVFGAGHPAVRFLLLLAIADDAAGLIILAIFYPSGELAPEWLLLSVAASVLAFVVFNWLPRKMDGGDEARRRSTWVRKNLGWLPYALAGCASWYGFAQAGIHPALGLLPVIPAIPHADRAFGIFSDAERYLKDTLNQMEHAMAGPVEVVLFFFGLLNAGVEFNAISEATWLVLAGLIIGKPVGILLFGWLAAYPMRLGLPAGMRTMDLVVVGFVSAIGFTVSLFVASVAFPAGAVQDAAKMGALFSFGAVFLSFAAGKLLSVQKQHSEEEAHAH